MVVEKHEMNKTRPKHFALHKIKLPLSGYVSILHRVSGAILFLALPLLLCRSIKPALHRDLHQPD